MYYYHHQLEEQFAGRPDFLVKRVVAFRDSTTATVRLPLAGKMRRSVITHMLLAIDCVLIIVKYPQASVKGLCCGPIKSTDWYHG